jgi:gamma-glutamylcyclotransferase (GGCT)/AIG2-like uncharacterized protein YtfP
LVPPTAATFRLFAYGTFLPGEVDHEVIAAARHLGPARTAQGYTLVELNAFAGLLEEKEGGQVAGEVYELAYETLDACDKRRDHPRRYRRKTIPLEDGTTAEAYLILPEQALGRRRLRAGDWRSRFKKERPEAGPFVRWARDRNRR